MTPYQHPKLFVIVDDQILRSQMIHEKYRPKTLENQQFFRSMYQQSSSQNNQMPQHSWSGISSELFQEASTDKSPKSIPSTWKEAWHKFLKNFQSRNEVIKGQGQKL